MSTRKTGKIKKIREKEKGIKKRQLLPQRFIDRQLCRPVGECSRCRGELYRGDIFWQIEGSLICEECLDTFARSYFAPCRVAGEDLTQEDMEHT